jgi:transcription elongation factor GreA
MIRTARIIEVKREVGVVSLFDIVNIYNEKLGKEKRIQIVTTLRQNALEGYVSKESPLGSALLGHKVGESVLVRVSDTVSYYVKILSVEPAPDNENLPISSY